MPDRNHNRTIQRKTLKLAIPLSLIFVLLFTVIYGYLRSHDLAAAHEKERDSLILHREHLQMNILSVFSDLTFLSSQQLLGDAIGDDARAVEHLNQEYLEFAKARGLYDRISLLNQEGMERVRINYNDGISEIVAPTALEHQGERYYFRNVMRMSPGEFFISPMDQHWDQSALQQPTKPILLFATPIANDLGEIKGIIILNYLGKQLLDAFIHVGRQALGRGLLVDSEGYWLKGLNDEDEWVFMYPDGDRKRFQDHFPDAWPAISANRRGQLETSSGLFTYETLTPRELQSRRSADGAIAEQLPVSWKIISYVPHSDISELTRPLRITLIAVTSSVLLMIYLLSMKIARGAHAKELASRQLVEKNRSLKREHEQLNSTLNALAAKKSELEQAYHDLHATQIELMHGEKMRSVGQLAAGIAHEINTPIQFVGDNTRFFEESFKEVASLLASLDQLVSEHPEQEVLADQIRALKKRAEELDITYLCEEVPSAIHQTLEGIEHVAGIVRSMKEFSHPGTKNKQLVDINKLLQNAVTISRNEWKYIAETELQLAEDLPEIYCLPAEINQVLLNLIINAVHAIQQAMDKGTIEHGRILLTSSLNADMLEITIDDNGTGMPEEITSKIFEPFFTTKDVGKGTGQGLSIAYTAIVDNHGGSIDVESKLNEGTRFTIRIPAGDP